METCPAAPSAAVSLSNNESTASAPSIPRLSVRILVSTFVILSSFTALHPRSSAGLRRLGSTTVAELVQLPVAAPLELTRAGGVGTSFGDVGHIDELGRISQPHAAGSFEGNCVCCGRNDPA